MTRQLTFDLPVRTAMGREDFFVSPANALAVAALEHWQDWPLGKMLLTGPEGAGKTHLAAVWAAGTGAAILQAADLAGADLPTIASSPVVVEDAPRLAGSKDGEDALFHLHNLMAAAGQPLLITARDAPAAWGLQLADLLSRLQGTAVVALAEPDDALLSALLLKLFSDRQISVAPSLIQYLVPRMGRSFAAARALVAALDARALADGRPITRALAAQVIGDDQTEAAGLDTTPAGTA